MPHASPQVGQKKENNKKKRRKLDNNKVCIRDTGEKDVEVKVLGRKKAPGLMLGCLTTTGSWLLVLSR